jgi:hypothetical protein
MAAYRVMMRTVLMSAAPVKLRSDGRREARERPRSKPRRSRETGACLTVILNLEKERINWSNMLQKAMEIDCVRCRPKLARQLMEPVPFIAIKVVQNGSSVRLPAD